MKTRIRLESNERYTIQWKTFLFWNTWGTKGFSFFENEWDTEHSYGTKDMAIQALVEMVQIKEQNEVNNKAARVILEIDSDNVKNKLAEYFV